MEDAIHINALLQRLQEETPNCGGQYHFTLLSIPPGNGLLHRLQTYFKQFDSYRHPYTWDEREKRELYDAERDMARIMLTMISSSKLPIMFLYYTLAGAPEKNMYNLTLFPGYHKHFRAASRLNRIIAGSQCEYRELLFKQRLIFFLAAAKRGASFKLPVEQYACQLAAGLQ